MGDSVATNRKARFRFEILDTVEAGIALVGSEVKSVRGHGVNFTDSYARIEGNAVYLYSLDIAPYDKASVEQHDPQRRRTLLLHKREIKRLKGRTNERGLTLVPLKMYFNDRGYAKVLLGVAKGKTLIDKRQDVRKRDAENEMRRARGRRRRR